MIYTAENKTLKIAVDAAGAQLQSIYAKREETEYLWQGDPSYWSGRAYILFPTIGRMYKNNYTYRGETYSLQCHGIARYRAFRLVDRTATKLRFRLTEDEDSMQNYPFRFRFDVLYSLSGNKLEITYEVENTDEKQLIFALGGHPGFNIPFGGGKFEDYYIEFPERSRVTKHTLSRHKFMSGKTVPMPLDDGVRLPLQHDLFDDDAVILGNTCRRVAIKNTADTKKIVCEFPDFKYLGIWHTPETDAPFVCLEPWSALPATEGQTDDLETKPDMYRLDPGGVCRTTWSVEICD